MNVRVGLRGGRWGLGIHRVRKRGRPFRLGEKGTKRVRVLDLHRAKSQSPAEANSFPRNCAPSLKIVRRTCNSTTDRKRVSSTYFLLQDVLIDQYKRVNPPTKLSSDCLLLIVERLSRRFCGGGDFLELINKSMVSDHIRGSHGR